MELRNAIYWRTMRKPEVTGPRATHIVTEETNGFIAWVLESAEVPFDEKPHRFLSHFHDREEALEYAVGAIQTLRKQGWRPI